MSSYSTAKVREGNRMADEIIRCLAGDQNVSTRIKTIVQRLREAADRGDLN